MTTQKDSVGILVGRFQTPDLHEGHIALINEVASKHSRLVIFVCSTPDILVTRRNPLDYFTRASMISALYPNVVVAPLRDMPSDEDWSKALDDRILEHAGSHLKVTLYGSRDAFIPYYSGKYETIELESSVDISATQVRADASDTVRKNSEFRRGVTYAAFNRHHCVYPTVDIALYKQDLAGTHIVVGRKANDIKGMWRLPGGFVDKADDDLEAAAKRELLEEVTGPEVAELKYIGSSRIDDWRYRTETDGIITSLFVAKHVFGPIEAGDDLDEVKWILLNDKTCDNIISGHKPLVEKIRKHLS